ncbi:MAG: flippase, partial [Ferruginibacter sp.]|nr:flippase [Ferruginibacter sp.]
MNKAQSWVYHRALARPGLILLANNAAWLILEKIIKILLALTVGAWMARNLGPDDYGQLAYALTFIILFQGVANLSADGFVVRDLSRHPKNSEKILGSVFLLRLITGILCWVISVISIYFFSPTDKKSFILILILGSSLVFQSAETVDLWLQSQSKNKLTAKAKIFAYIIANTVRIILLLLNAPLWTFATIASTEVFFTAIALRIAYKSSPTIQRWKFDKKITLKLIQQTWPLIISGFFGAIYLRVDQILIKEILGNHALGIYAAAIQISQVGNIIPVVLATSLGPMISKLRTTDPVLYEKRIVLIFRIFFYTGLFISLLISVFSKLLIILLYGESYVDAIPILR